MAVGSQLDTGAPVLITSQAAKLTKIKIHTARL